jgi:uncharacterized coiled-coil DUF342 family protein
VEPADLTVRILQEIREEIRGLRDDQRNFREEIVGLRADQQSFREETATRFEVLETTLRDLAQQLVVLARGVKVAIEQHGNVDARLDDHEQRLLELERRA